MIRLTFDEIKAKKNFYSKNYRRAISVLWVSMGLMILLTIAVMYRWSTQPKSHYYATNTIGLISLLKQIDGPNKSSEALLKPDPVEEFTVKKLDI